jgi:hypothetical protein
MTGNEEGSSGWDFGQFGWYPCFLIDAGANGILIFAFLSANLQVRR